MTIESESRCLHDRSRRGGETARMWRTAVRVCDTGDQIDDGDRTRQLSPRIPSPSRRLAASASRRLPLVPEPISFLLLSIPPLESLPMSEPFLSSDDYDEQAHQLYNEARYDEALTLLREGLSLYPHAVELHVGLAYAHLAREEFAWAARAFETAIALDPDHEDALAGFGEVLLKLGRREQALQQFERILSLGFDDDCELMLQLGRACFREGLHQSAYRYFELSVQGAPELPEPAACAGYASHRLGLEAQSIYWLRRALESDPDYAEARIYLANLLYDKGEYTAPLPQPQP